MNQLPNNIFGHPNNYYWTPSYYSQYYLNQSPFISANTGFGAYIQPFQKCTQRQICIQQQQINVKMEQRINQHAQPIKKQKKCNRELRRKPKKIAKYMPMIIKIHKKIKNQNLLQASQKLQEKTLKYFDPNKAPGYNFDSQNQGIKICYEKGSSQQSEYEPRKQQLSKNHQQNPKLEQKNEENAEKQTYSHIEKYVYIKSEQVYKPKYSKINIKKKNASNEKIKTPKRAQKLSKSYECSEQYLLSAEALRGLQDIKQIKTPKRKTPSISKNKVQRIENKYFHHQQDMGELNKHSANCQLNLGLFPQHNLQELLIKQEQMDFPRQFENKKSQIHF